MTSNNNNLEQFEDQAYLNLETYRTNGEGVKTPVWFVQDDNTFFVRTVKDSWKVKRLRSNPQVSIVPSDRAGEPLGEWTAGQGKVIEDEAVDKWVKDQFKKKYGLQKLLFDVMGRMRGDQLVTVEMVVE